MCTSTTTIKAAFQSDIQKGFNQLSKAVGIKQIGDSWVNFYQQEYQKGAVNLLEGVLRLMVVTTVVAIGTLAVQGALDSKRSYFDGTQTSINSSLDSARATPSQSGNPELKNIQILEVLAGNYQVLENRRRLVAPQKAYTKEEILLNNPGMMPIAAKSEQRVN